MKIHQGLSLRYKFLLLLTILPLLALGVYLLVAIQVFENDKIAYVFDSSGSVARSISAQVRAELNAAINLSRPIVSAYSFEKNEIAPYSKRIFANESSFAFLAFYRSDPGLGRLTQVEMLRKPSDPFAKATKKTMDRLDEKDPKFLEMLNRVREHGVVVLPGLAPDDRLVLGIRYGAQGDSKMLVVLALINTENIAPVFKSTSGQKLFLTNREGHVFLGGKSNNESNNLSRYVDASFVKRLSNKGVPEGTAETKGPDGKSLLVSYSPVGYGGLMTIAAIEKEKALAAVDILIEKSLLFFVALVSLTIIISIIASGTLTQSLTSLYYATQKVADGQFDIRVRVNSSDEVGSLAHSFNVMAAQIKRLLMLTAEKARMEGELKTAKTVQETLFPDRAATISNLQIAGHYQPASECGGDWWHYCEVGSKVFLWIGDATGHGAPAALMTSAAKSAATIIERLNVTPGVALELLNRSIYDVSKGQLMMTFFLGSYDTETGEFVYSNASHDPPLLFEKSEQPLKKRHLLPLNDVNNPRLGQDRNTQFKEYKMQLKPGSSIFLYTDGIPELYNNQGKMWGERNFLKAVIQSNNSYPSPTIAVQEMVKKIESFRNNAPLRDDVTFFQIHLKEA